MLLGLAVVLVLAALSLSGCWLRAPRSVPSGPQSEASPSPEPTVPVAVAPEPSATPPSSPAQEPVARTTVRVYLVRGEYLGVGTGRSAPVTTPARSAMTQLLLGPSAAEKAMGLGTEIPKGTKLLGLSISGNTATVNLSSTFESGGGTLSMTVRIAQVVNTLTQFKGVTRVAFKLDGKKVESIGGEGIMVSPPVSRADFDSALPAIMLESPLPLSTIASPVRITGSANVFEAQFRVRVTDAAGKVVADKPVMATSGSGTRGLFNELITYKPAKHGKGSITVYEVSAEDGSETNPIEIPIYL